jgi:hypothetical protein
LDNFSGGFAPAGAYAILRKPNRPRCKMTESPPPRNWPANQRRENLEIMYMNSGYMRGIIRGYFGEKSASADCNHY